MSEKNSGEVILAFVLGGIIGAALGIMFAPASGKETRKKLKDIGEDLEEKIEDLGAEVKTKTKNIVHEGKEKIVATAERFEEAFEAGKKAFAEKKNA